MNDNRLLYIDFLKTIGLLFVILAHVNPPVFVNQFRSFDVCLLVILSGFLAGRGSVNEDNFSVSKALKYIKKRFHRIVVPAWIFIVLFFLVQSLFYNMPTIKESLLTITFQRDCGLLGYLWIIWVFFVCACMIPVISKLKLNAKNLLTWGGLILIVEILAFCTELEHSRILYCTLFTMIPYGFLTYLGCHLEQINVKKWILLSGLIFVLSSIILYLIHDEFITVGTYKYPARIYYLSYGICITLLLYKFVKTVPEYLRTVVLFISQNTLWIYFWHILFIYVLQYFSPIMVWWLKYIILVTASIIVVFLQKKITDRYIDKVYLLRYFRG